MSPRLVARTVAAGRALLGGALLVAPDRVTERWVGTTAEPVRLLARGLGARDLALGLATLAVIDDRRDARRWLAAAVVADATDAVANAAAGERIPAQGRWATVALAGGSALVGLWLTRRI